MYARILFFVFHLVLSLFGRLSVTDRYAATLDGADRAHSTGTLIISEEDPDAVLVFSSGDAWVGLYDAGSGVLTVQADPSCSADGAGLLYCTFATPGDLSSDALCRMSLLDRGDKIVTLRVR